MKAGSMQHFSKSNGSLDLIKSREGKEQRRGQYGGREDEVEEGSQLSSHAVSLFWRKYCEQEESAPGARQELHISPGHSQQFLLS
eukprot:349682-Chlamydomonas_euryale.AAC.2